VKFYTGAAIPDTPEHRRVLRSMVERLACRQPVVALGAGVRLDEHEDYIFGGVPNVIAIDQAMQPQANLAVQTEVIRRSSLFVGTAGSLAWLAPMLGVDTVACLRRRSLPGTSSICGPLTVTRPSARADSCRWTSMPPQGSTPRGLQ
jgi:hypothetical protein